MKHLALPALLLSAAAACRVPTPQDLPPTDPRLHRAATPGALPLAGAPAYEREPVLYARDGSVVGGRPAGTVDVTEGTTREVAGAEGTRMYLLELYQKTIEEKETLALEVEGLSAALQTSEAEVARLQSDKAALESRVAAQAEEVARLRAESLDLAGRLATAQVRRLQAEKILLEAKIDWQRMQLMIDEGTLESGADAPFTEGAATAGEAAGGRAATGAAPGGSTGSPAATQGSSAGGQGGAAAGAGSLAPRPRPYDDPR